MTRYFYALVPLLVLVMLASTACLVSYGLVQVSDALPLHKIISKTTLVFLVLSIFPAMSCLQLSKEDLGFASKPVFFRQLGQGFALGFITLLPVIGVLYALGVNVIDDNQIWTIGKLFSKLGVALLLALLISLLEEPLFRGVLLAGLSKKLPLIAAVLLSAAYYAALHFVTNKTPIPVGELNLLSAFKLLWAAFANLSNPAIFTAFLALFMVGIFLGLLRTQAKLGLGLCIGCHTAWVWQIKTSKELFNTDANSAYLYLVNSYDGVIGPLVAVWLAIVMAAGWFYYRLQR